MTDFILGMGGSGAKCVEALVHLAECGLGPDAAHIGLLDQDRSNGNAATTAQVLDRYVRLRSALRQPGGFDLAGSPLLRMRVDRPSAGWIWTPEERAAATLAGSIGYPSLPADEQGLAEALFNHQERQLVLDEGFRQRPALGAALTLQGVHNRSAIWQDLMAALGTAGQGNEVRIFLVASIFGGTGAAAFPTVARLLRTEIDNRRLQGRVRLGGALLLPYFAFPAPPLEGGPAIRPDSSAFMMQARGALEYYGQLLPDEGVFERLYLVGCDPLIPLPDYADGGASQSNPPLLPEFAAALAGLDFLHRREDGSQDTLVTGTSSGEAAGWTHLPFEMPGEPNLLQHSVAATLRTALAWHHHYGPALGVSGWHASAKEAWFRRMFGRTANTTVASPAAQETITGVTALFDALLRWFVALNRGGAGAGHKLALLDDALVAGPAASNAADAMRLLPGVTNKQFANFVLPSAGPGLAAVFHRMTYAPLPERTGGLGMVLAALHAACASPAGKA